MNTLTEIKSYIQTFGLSQGIEERIIKLTQVAYFIGQEDGLEKAKEILKEVRETI